MSRLELPSIIRPPIESEFDGREDFVVYLVPKLLWKPKERALPLTMSGYGLVLLREALFSVESRPKEEGSGRGTR